MFRTWLDACNHLGTCRVRMLHWLRGAYHDHSRKQQVDWPKSPYTRRISWRERCRQDFGVLTVHQDCWAACRRTYRGTVRVHQTVQHNLHVQWPVLPVGKSEASVCGKVQLTYRTSAFKAKWWTSALRRPPVALSDCPCCAYRK